MSNLSFRGMAVLFRIRDLLRPRDDILEEAGIEEGLRVLDYGCGTGSYSIPAAKTVGGQGRIFALDIHPLALEMVTKRAAESGVGNIQTILSDCATGLPGGSVDVVLLYDIFHMLNNREEVLRELHRVLKPEGILSFRDHHMKGEDIRRGVTEGALFKLVEKGKRTYSFRPV